jgi:alpha-mannosidase
MAMPVNTSNGEVAYEVPYGVVRVGKDEMPGAAGERYETPNAELHPHGIANWINVSGEKLGLTLSSSVAVADYIDPTDTTFAAPACIRRHNPTIHCNGCQSAVLPHTVK